MADDLTPGELRRQWEPWLAPTEVRGEIRRNPELESSFRELVRYVAPEALGDVRWADEPATDVSPDPADDSERAMVSRLYERLARQRIDFWREPWLPGEAGQRIRHPWLLVHGRAGTCLDFATTFAAMCLDAAIPPLLVLTWGRTVQQHAFVIATPGREVTYLGSPDEDAQDELPAVSDLQHFVRGFERSSAEGVVRLDDWDALEGALEDGSMLVVDFDRAPDEHAIAFEQAAQRARDHLRAVRAHGASVWLVDVAWLQHNCRELTPLPPPATRAPIRRYIPGGRPSFDRYDSHAAILADLQRRHGTVVLLGDSGTGKSTLAREIAYAAQFGAAWFLTASESQALINSLDRAERAELENTAESMEHPDRTGFATNGLARLSEAQDEWVVVVDNADGDPGELLPWLPQPNPNRPAGVRQLVLITTTNPAWKQHGLPVRELEPVDEQEAIRFLPGPELAPMVQGRPLLFDAFTRMAAATGWDGARIATYAPASGAVAPELVGPATLWASARDTDDFDDDALTVSAHAAYLPPDRQPLSVAVALAPQVDVRAVRELLVDLGLFSVDVDADVVRMHRLFGAAIRADLEAREPSPADGVVPLVATNEQATRLLDHNGDLATITHIETWLEDLDTRADDPDRQLGTAMHGAAVLLELHGHTRRSGERYATAERHLQGDPLLLALGLHGRARTINQHHRRDEQRLREALDWSRSAETMLQAVDAPDRAERCLAMQGLLMQKLAAFPRAGETRIGLLRDALEVIERADELRHVRLAFVDPDNPHPELLRSRFNRAGIRINLAQAEPDEAEQHLAIAQEVYATVEQARRQIYARDRHPHVAACVIGRGYVAYYRALLVAGARLEQTGLLREATDRTLEALATRQAQEGGLDQDEVDKCLQFLSKVTLAREVLAMTPSDTSASSLRSKLGHRVEDALQEIVHGLAVAP